MSEQTMWGLHAGRTGDANNLFLKKNFVAVGWHKLGDLSGIAPNQEAFKAVVAKAYPEAKPEAIPRRSRGLSLTTQGSSCGSSTSSSPAI